MIRVVQARLELMQFHKANSPINMAQAQACATKLVGGMERVRHSLWPLLAYAFARKSRLAYAFALTVKRPPPPRVPLIALCQ